ncbi:hypothetical protein MMC17_004972 [Xylographa soralifera]|nr:hypothetical protein [Xylographa soralifera]
MGYETETKVGTDATSDGVSDIMCTLVIGEERQEFLVKKDYLIDIEYFKCALKDGRWKEGRDNRIELPEDDPELWRIAIDFIMTNEFQPHVVPTCNCIIGELWCHSPRFDPPVQVIDADDVSLDFNVDEDQVGDWRYPDTTLAILENLVGIFCLANKYLWLPLLASCMEKLRYFPMGPAALPVLAVTVGERQWSQRSEECWDEGLCDEFHELVQDTFKYHAANYDSATVHSHTLLDYSWQETPKPYEPLKEFFRANMTEEAWKAFTLLEDNRLERREKIRFAMDAAYWECSEERQGVCIVAWDKRAHDRASTCYLKRKQDARLRESKRTASQTFCKTHSEACLCENMSTSGQTYHQHQEEHHAQMKDADDSSVKIMEEKVVREEKACADSVDTQNFAEAEIGDLITQIKDDVPDGRYVTGLVLRTNRRGWFPGSVLRLFEQRSRKHCCGECCERQSFKHDGCRYYLDDPRGQGVKFRKGRKSRGWRRTGGPRMADHTRTVDDVLRLQDRGTDLDSDSLSLLHDAFW